MNRIKRPTEADVFDLQTGIGESDIPFEDKHFFDIAGYLVLEDLLTPDQVAQARDTLSSVAAASTENMTVLSRSPAEKELINIIEGGGTVEDAMALPRVIEYVQAFIWGNQYRLVGSRGILRTPGAHTPLTQGGRADPRRYARYRCFGDGQFRCLMITCLIALCDTANGDGVFCAIPASHKANLPHPYADTDLNAIPSLREIPLQAGAGVLFTENLSHAFKPPARRMQAWLSYQYGPSYMVNCPGCEPSAGLLARTADDPDKSHLLLEPYYHPTGSQKKKTM
ncbi:MAG: phytanoyl-CoA dioxygenase family protein [Candidatus Poribacteria bacterium]|nr:phytanoyl-CoA dioxygenase family protein [Candidatus Poribacteria bacterium]